jgi:hypothetical protein
MHYPPSGHYHPSGRTGLVEYLGWMLERQGAHRKTDPASARS